MENYTENFDLNDLPGEVWKDVAGYEGLYMVSNLGRVKALERTYVSGRPPREMHVAQRILHTTARCARYCLVCLCKDGKHKTISVHRLVAKAFLPNPNNYPQIDHINAIKSDNRAQNLRWCTAKQNANNPLRVALYVGSNNPYYGKHHTPEIIEKMRERNKHNKAVLNVTTGQIFRSARETARQLGVCKSAVLQAIYRKGTCRGMEFRYL